MTAASILRDARRRAGLSQRGLGRRAGVPQATVARIEEGRTSPRFETLDRLLAACGFDLVARPRRRGSKGEGRGARRRG
ncbi:MAG TPA: helix-turn-helix transcriptional regulator [Thermoanaerobaculia bacterium]|nr:helix-turn-helix transcriptional regulator [Thermoanaerobaculia bacterium]